MSNHSMIIAQGNTAQRNFQRINAALTAAAADPLDAPQIKEGPTILAPSVEEVATAVLAAKDPSTDKAVAALAQRAFLAEHPALQTLPALSWTRAWDDARHTLPGILEDLASRYQALGQDLTDHARGPLGAYEDLGRLDLANLDARTANEAAAAIATFREMELVYAAWRTITTTLEGGRKQHWSEVAAPSNSQYIEATTSTPPNFPSCDSWSVARHGWKHELAASLTDAHTARTAYSSNTDAVNASTRERKLKMSLLGGGGFYGDTDRTVTVPSDLL